MEDYEYLCLTLSGEYLRGELSVHDKDQLAAELWEHKLFLVWWKSIGDSSVVGPAESNVPTIPQPRAILIAEAKSLWDSLGGERNVSARRPSSWNWDLSVLSKPQVIAVVISLFVGTAIYDIHHLMSTSNRKQHVPLEDRPAPPDVQVKLSKIRVGVTRGSVDKLFPQFAPEKGSSVWTRYEATPNFLVEIGFDTTGGEWSPENKVRAGPDVHFMSKPMS